MDATLVLKGKLASAGGLKAFGAKAGHSRGPALHAIEAALSKVLPLTPENLKLALQLTLIIYQRSYACSFILSKHLQ